MPFLEKGPKQHKNQSSKINLTNNSLNDPKFFINFCLRNPKKYGLGMRNPPQENLSKYDLNYTQLIEVRLE